MRLILASSSPRRAELLRAAGFTFDVLAVEIDERVRPEEAPESYVRRLAAGKSAAGLIQCVPANNGRYLRDATAGARKKAAGGIRQATASEVRGGERDWISEAGDAGQPPQPGGSHSGGADGIIILAADTAVVVDDDILGKPRHDRDATAMLRRLSGRSHRVMTGVSVRVGASEVGAVEITTVEFQRISDRDVAWYVASGEWRDKAGGYAIQGLGSRFIPRIEGSYSNVVGLPVARVFDLLTAQGFLASDR